MKTCPEMLDVTVYEAVLVLSASFDSATTLVESAVAVEVYDPAVDCLVTGILVDADDAPAAKVLTDGVDVPVVAETLNALPVVAVPLFCTVTLALTAVVAEFPLG